MSGIFHMEGGWPSVADIPEPDDLAQAAPPKQREPRPQIVTFKCPAGTADAFARQDPGNMLAALERAHDDGELRILVVID